MNLNAENQDADNELNTAVEPHGPMLPAPVAGDTLSALKKRRMPTLAFIVPCAIFVCLQILHAAEPDLAALLDMSLEDLSRIEVSSVSRKVEPLNHAASAIDVITAEDIRRSGVTSIAEALRLSPGLQVARINSHSWAITSRGFNDLYANKLLVLIDGRSVYTPLFAGVYWDAQDLMLEDVDRIEVIRGPGATMWGANAVNGVINITTKSAKATQGTLLTAGYGTEEQGFGAIRYGGKLSDTATYRVYAKYFNRDESVFSSGKDANDAWQGLRGGFRTDWELDTQNLFTLQGDAYHNREHETYNFWTPAFPFTEPGRETFDVYGANALARWTHSFSDESELRIQTYYDRTHRQADFFEEIRDTADVELQYRFPLGERHDVMLGAGYRYSHSDIGRSNFTIWYQPEDRGLNVFSTFVQDQITLVQDRLVLTLGSKFEYNDYTHWELQPSGRLTWSPDDHQTVWAAASRAVRTPARSGRDLRLTAFTAPPGTPFNPFPIPLVYTIVGTNDFKSETLVAYELGYRILPKNWLSFDVAGFYNEYDNLTTFEQATIDSSAAPVYLRANSPFLNQMEGETYGAEIGANVQVTDWWMLRGSYSYLQMQLHKKPGSADTFSEAAEGASPHHQAILRSLMDLPWNLQLDCTARYVDSLPALAIPSYTAFDVRLGWRPHKNLELSFVAQNLFDDRHPEYRPSVLLEQQTESQRAFYARITWRF